MRKKARVIVSSGPGILNFEGVEFTVQTANQEKVPAGHPWVAFVENIESHYLAADFESTPAPAHNVRQQAANGDLR